MLLELCHLNYTVFFAFLPKYRADYLEHFWDDDDHLFLTLGNLTSSERFYSNSNLNKSIKYVFFSHIEVQLK